MSKLKLTEELEWRGFVNQTTYKDINAINSGPISFYWGVDPSADSMQIGNLATAMMVKHFIKHGHKAYLLVGGATGMIGDPDGKKEERELKSIEEIESNKRAIVRQYRTIFEGEKFTIVDNYDWFKDIKYLDFLRNIGKHVPVRQMISRDFVQSRLGEGGAGISYAEFSYSLIQGYDFLYLHEKNGVDLQVCGADQWGNSITGVDLIRRIFGHEVNVWSAPLIVNKQTGLKFGKTEEGVVWLDANKTSPYKFYQFWINVDDEGVEDYLKVYTELDNEEIEDLMNKFVQDKAARVAQKRLAYEVTKLIHGEDTAEKQVRIAEAVRLQSIEGLDQAELKSLKTEIPNASIKASSSPAEVLVSTRLASSNSEARSLLNAGAVYINGKVLPDDYEDMKSFAGQMIFVRKGKVLKNTAIVEIK